VAQRTKTDYKVVAELKYNPPAPGAFGGAPMLNAARASLTEEARARRNLGYAVTLDDITRALQVRGVRNSTITSPTADLIPTDESTYYYLVSMSLSIAAV